MNAPTDTTDTEAKVYAPGSWQSTLEKSATLFERSGKARKQASALLWQGGIAAIEDWMTNNADTDVNAENMYADVLDVLGVPRKGDASKIKSVGLAVRNNGLVLALYPNLSKAYAEATRLTRTVQAQAAEDTAADEAISAIEAPKSATTAENAALIVLKSGVDEAARLLLDALGATNTAAHRAFVRAITQEIAGRIAPAPKPAKKASAPKPVAAKKASAPKPGVGANKPKPAPAKGAAKKAAASVKPKPVPVESVPEDSVPTVGDMFDEVVGDDTEATENPAPSGTAKPKPVRRGPVRRAS